MQREEIQQQMRQPARKRRRKKKRLQRFLIVLLSLLVIAALAALIIWKVFTVENVEVEGNEHYSSEQIQKFVLNDEYSWNSLYVLIKYHFLQTDEIPFVDTMEVSRKNPHTVNVHVDEKGIL